MATLKSPLFSQDASGSLSATVTYLRQLTAPIVKRHSKPSNPRTQKQITIRCLMTFLSRYWGLLTTFEQESWGACLEPRTSTFYTTYLAHNQARWQRWLSPTFAYPAAEASVPSTTHGFVVYPKGDAAHLRITNKAIPVASGYLVFRHTASFWKPKYYYLIRVVPIQLGAYTWTDDRPPLGHSYYYKHKPFNSDGVLGPKSILKTFTPV